MKTLSLDKIRIDGGTQPRESIDTAYVSELAENADKLPALVVFFDGVEYWLADGFHRYHARRQASKSTALVDIREGTHRDAILFSVGANALHGLRRTNADKRKAVGMLLADAEWAGRSDGWLAEQCGVSQPFVSSLRTDNNYQLGRVGKDGKTRKLPTKETASAAVIPEPTPAVTPAPDAATPSAVDDIPMAEDEDVLVDSDDPIAGIIERGTYIQGLVDDLAGIRGDVERGIGEKDELFAEVNLSQFQADCNNAIRALKFSKPHAVCPYCAGRGRETKDCKACGGRGWLGKGKFNAAPEELKNG